MTAAPDTTVDGPQGRWTALAARPLVRAGAVVLFLVMVMVVRRLVDPRGFFFLEDDAWYYHRIALNIARHGFSSFDGLVATNGYHPLWQMVMAGAVFLFDVGVRGVILLQLVLVAAAVWIFLACLRRIGPLHVALVALYMPMRIQGILAHGMEVDLVFLAAATWFVAMARHADGRDGGSVHWLGATVAFCFLARIEAIVFVAPGALLLVRSNRARAVLLAEIVAVVGLYGAINMALFGLPMPISGAVKSLGGLQWNAALAEQLFPFGVSAKKIFQAPHVGRQFPPYLVAAALFLAFARRDRLLGAMTASIGLGLAVYWTKLFFFSSWQVWPWYDFPAILTLFLLVVTVDRVAARLQAAPGSVARYARLGEIVLAAGLVGFVGATARNGAWRTGPGLDTDFERMNAFAAEEVMRRLGPVPIAMGDRAGSFAAVHRGPVVQLEGLVSDKAHLAALRPDADMEARLCGLGVRHVISYQRDLGDYRELDIPVIRPELSGYRSSTYRARKENEVFALKRPDIFDNSETRDRDPVVYLWALDCDRAAR